VTCLIIFFVKEIARTDLKKKDVEEQSIFRLINNVYENYCSLSNTTTIVIIIITISSINIIVLLLAWER